jgi:nucleoside-diphosphate-sugar epimerase
LPIEPDTLEELLTRPRPELIEAMRGCYSPLVVLGAGGKMGPTLCVLARRAAEAAGTPLEVIAVSRFGDAEGRGWLEVRGVRTLACDLLDRAAWSQLPQADNVIYLVGLKFGTSRQPALTWAVNTLPPAYACERFAQARIVALSTGNVYPFVPVAGGGAKETDPLAPVGEYGQAALARERLFEFCSLRTGARVCLIRLNYAVELRYGVLVDIALKVFRGEPVDVTAGYLNCIWQADANEFILRALSLATTPPTPLNVTGPRAWSIRWLAGEFAWRFGRPATIVGTEADTALLSDSSKARALLGEPPTPLESMLDWTAEWIAAGHPLLNRPTHFEVRDGKF